MFSLKDKTILITGASSGIGEASAKLLAQTGARLILLARRADKLKNLVLLLEQEYAASCIAVDIDISNKEAVYNLFETLDEKWHIIDILINNAGLALTTDPLQDGNPDNWDVMIDTNLKGLLYITRLLLPGMITRGYGHIVNLGSVAGQDCYLNGNVYSATKHAVRAISKSLRLDLAGKPVRVTEIAPGAVETEFSLVRWKDAKRAKDFYKDFSPLLAEDIADAIVYCLTRPLHVDITELTLMSVDQSSCSQIHRKKPK